MAGTNYYTPISATCAIGMTDLNNKAMTAICTGTPPTTANVFAHGCQIVQTDSGTGNEAIYQNIGSLASPNWQLLGSGGGGSGLVVIPFNENIPFDRDYNFMTQLVSGPIAFAPDITDRIQGGSTYVHLVADGNNAPTFDATFIITSGTYDNTDTIVNRIIFFWNGYEYEVSIAQLGVFVGPDTTPPTITTVEAADAHTITVTFDEDVNGTDAGFTFDNGSPLTITGMTGTGTDSLTFTLAETVLSTDTVTYAYVEASGDIVDDNGNPLADASGSVDNNIIPPTISSAEAIDANTIVVVFSENVNGTDAGWSFDNGSALTISGVTGSTTDTWTFTIVETMLDTDTITFDYDFATGDTIDDLENPLASDSGSVTNSISGGSLIYLTMGGSSVPVTESPAHNFILPAAVYMKFAESMAGNGYVQTEQQTPVSDSAGIGLILDHKNAVDDLTSPYDTMVFSYLGTYWTNEGAYSPVNSSITATAADLTRLVRSVSTVTAQYSTNGGSSWTTIAVFSGTYSATMYAKAISLGVGGAGIKNTQALGMI